MLDAWIVECIGRFRKLGNPDAVFVRHRALRTRAAQAGALLKDLLELRIDRESLLDVVRGFDHQSRDR